MTKKYTRQRFIITEKTWPPDQPTNYIAQTLLYGYGEIDIMIRSVQRDDIQATVEVFNCSPHESHHNFQPLPQFCNTNRSIKVTKDITEILDTCKSSEFILIEGAQGMGKTILLKEIAYRWANNQLLGAFKIVLLVHLRDPKLHKVETLNDFLQYVFSDLSVTPSKIDACSKYFSKSDCKDVAFIFDGIDEFPVDLWENSYIYKIVKRLELPDCALIVSSRPHASASLRSLATVKVCLLGFTEIEQRKEFIKQSLKDQPRNIRDVTQYVEHDSTINSLSFVPLIMALLLYIHKFKRLSSSDFMHNVISLIVCRHLAKQGCSFNNAYDLDNLPDPWNRVIMQLCKLSLENLKSKKTKMTFGINQIKETCPDVVKNQGAIDDLGLLQGVQLCCLTGKTIEFCFMHSSIQDFLAAYHGHLLNNTLQSLKFFRFLFEMGRSKICKYIVNTKPFYGKAISLRGTTLSSSDVELLTFFLTHSSQQEWEELDLYGCNIQDCGIDILHQELMNHKITIMALSLSKNNLTELSSCKICDIVICCRVKVLSIRFNPKITKNVKLYSILSDSKSEVEELYMSHTNSKPSSTTAKLFSALAMNKRLRVLRVSNNNITDKDCDAIVMALKRNTYLVELIMFGNPINVKKAQQIVQVLGQNNTLQSLVLPRYPPEYQKTIKFLADEVRKKRHCRLNLWCHPL